MQRLYSTFPTGRPGIGLLLLRLAAGGSLVAERVSMMMPGTAPLWEAQTTLICVGICVCLGFWTPVMGGLEASAELLMVFARPGAYDSHAMLAVVALSLALLGPGAWSIDAVLFGRKRIAL